MKIFLRLKCLLVPAYHVPHKPHQFKVKHSAKDEIQIKYTKNVTPVCNLSVNVQESRIKIQVTTHFNVLDQRQGVSKLRFVANMTVAQQ